MPYKTDPNYAGILGVSRDTPLVLDFTVTQWDLHHP